MLQTVKRARAAGAGMDGWRPREMRCLAWKGADLAARIMEKAEETGQWPKQLLQSRAVYLAKQEGLSTGPSDNMILLMMPWLYRTWAKLRYHQMRGRYQQWEMPYHHTGAGNGGSEAAWMKTAMHVEHAKKARRAIAITALDIYKALDPTGQSTKA